MTTRKDTLYNFMEALDDIERNILVKELNKYEGFRNVHHGTLPFVGRHDAIKVLTMESDRSRNVEGCNNPTIDRIIERLTVSPEWVNITAIGDTHHKEMHVITGEIRNGRPVGFNGY